MALKTLKWASAASGDVKRPTENDRQQQKVAAVLRSMPALVSYGREAGWAGDWNRGYGIRAANSTLGKSESITS